MKQFKAFIVISGLAVPISIVLMIVALLVLSWFNPPYSGNFNLFEGFEFVAAILAGGIYGFPIGVFIGVLSSAFYILAVQNIENNLPAYLAMTLFGTGIGFAAFLFVYLQSTERELVLPAYFMITVFLISFIPQLVMKKFVEERTIV